MAAGAPIVVAHRGDSGSFPENTLPAFAAALEVGAGMIEFDVHDTSDGVPVCIHDDTLDRTTDAAVVFGRSGSAVAQVRAADLASLDAGRWKGECHGGARIPTLQLALALMLPRTVPMIEHKGGQAATLVELLRRVGAVDRVLVQSFDWDFVRRVGALEPRLTLGALGEGPLTAERLAQAAATRAVLVHWNVHDLRAEDVVALHARGLLCCVYTANTDVELAGAAALGVDAITTNHPARLRALIAEGYVRPRPKSGAPD